MPARLFDLPDNDPPDHPDVVAADALDVDAIDEAARIRETLRAALRADQRYGTDRPWGEYLALMRLAASPQSYGKRVESRLICEDGAWDHLGLDDPGERWLPVAASADRGDARIVAADATADVDDPDAGAFVEIKVSFVQHDGGNVNFLQIRPWQDLDGYRIYVVDLDHRLHRFDLTAEQMHAELAATGSSVAHGTRDGAEGNDRVEYAVRFAWSDDDETCVRWWQRYAAA